jgi:hypothetical protein
MKRAAKEEEALRVERQRKEKAEQWTRRRAVQERRLRLAKEQAGRDVADGLKAVARLQAVADMPAGATAALEDSSSDEEERQPLARRASTAVKAGGGSAKRKAVASALDDSEEEGSGGCKENSQRPSTQRKAKLRRTVSLSTGVGMHEVLPSRQGPRTQGRHATHTPKLSYHCPTDSWLAMAMLTCALPAAAAGHCHHSLPQPLFPPSNPGRRCSANRRTGPTPAQTLRRTSCRCLHAPRWRPDLLPLLVPLAGASSCSWPSGCCRALWRLI